MNAETEPKPLTQDRWQRMELIFHGVLQVPEAERTEFLLKSCQDDSVLLAEVQDLLTAFEDQKHFTAPPEAHSEATEPKGRAGEIVGGYMLDAEIGQGGMGTVYLAHRADGEFEHQVALKVVSSHLRTRFFTERFRAERQILASLNHPNITRLLDGGVTGEGDPYLVMEYVNGQAINRYCDERLLPVADRIRLFLDACSAVEYAHRNLVVHRDLKPGNLLVTGGGVPKLLDFGTAKLLLNSGEESATTRFGAMTLRYASPEQLRGEPVSTSMDVYALGIMLYELLVGAWPFGDPDSPVAGLERAVRDIDPAPPRSLISDQSARLRSTSPAKLARILDGDLGNILRKAVEANPHRRYTSVEHLSADLRHYLNGEPVLARAGTVFYRAGKFIRRNRLAAAAAFSFIVVLAGSSVYSYRQAQAARREAEKSAMVTEFLRGVLGSADPTDEGSGKDMTVVQALDKSRAELDQLSAQPQVKAYLHYTLGITYSNLSDYAKAEEQLRRALAIGRNGATDEDLAWAETGLGGVLTRLGKNWDEAEELHRDALARVRKMGRNANPQLIHIAAGQYAYLIWKKHGHSAKAESMAREAVDLARVSPAIPRPWLVIGDYELAQYLLEENRDDEAAKLLAEGLGIERGFAKPTASLGPLLSTLGALRAKQGDLAAAENFQRQYRDEALRTLGPNHPFTLEAISTWATTRARLGHLDEALEETGKATETARRVLERGSLGLWRPYVARAFVLNLANRAKEAGPLAQESFDSITNTNPEDGYHAASWAELGIAAASEHRLSEAVSALENAERIYLKLGNYGPHHFATMRVRAALDAARTALVAQSR